MTEEQYRATFVKKLHYYMEKTGTTQADLIRDLGFKSATVSNWYTGQKLPRMDKIQKLADYFHIEKSDLLEEKEQSDSDYYINPETAKLAQELFDDPDLRMLFDAARGSDPEDLRMAADFLRRLKEGAKK